VEVLTGLPASSIDLSIFSPPFLSLYTYSNSERDLGNCADHAEFEAHFRFIVRALLRVTRPGRLAVVHIAQIASQKSRDGVIGLIDLRGLTIRLFQGCGWVYHGDVTIDKNPQAQAVRMKVKGLLFVQLHKDASWLRPALADYLLIFRAPGENTVPIRPDISNEDWILWAHPVWYDIHEGDVLSVREARESDDERHLAPLQLGLIERAIRLWSNPGEVVLSPFAGIGSEGYQAIRLGRKFVGIELKQSYFVAAVRNCRRAETIAGRQLELPG
jgi:DNA modification methylase